jgi:hypothetical protein
MGNFKVTIYHIDAHRYFHIDHIGLITAQVLCGLCENPIVVYVVNSYQKLIIGANNQSVLALVSLKGITHCIWATSEEGEVKSPSSEMFTC